MTRSLVAEPVRAPDWSLSFALMRVLEQQTGPWGLPRTFDSNSPTDVAFVEGLIAAEVDGAQQLWDLMESHGAIMLRVEVG
jgi:hypothetical protein